MKEQIGENRARHTALRGSRIARLKTAIFPLHRRLQPTLNVEQHPGLVGMFPKRPEKEPVVETVEGPYDTLPISKSFRGRSPSFVGPILSKDGACRF
jgi:hypothetical protein